MVPLMWKRIPALVIIWRSGRVGMGARSLYPNSHVQLDRLKMFPLGWLWFAFAQGCNVIPKAVLTPPAPVHVPVLFRWKRRSFGDRPLEITLQRTWDALSLGERLDLAKAFVELAFGMA